MFRKILETISKACQKLFIFIIRIYQVLISPLLGPRCRFYPSCSSYGVESIQRHGALLGLFYAVKRILRCHPFSTGGYDPVPTEKSKRINHGL